MNANPPQLSRTENTQPTVDFFRIPAPGKRDPFFGLSRGWYYQAAALGEIKMVAIRRRGTVRGVRFVIYNSVRDYIRRASAEGRT